MLSNILVDNQKELRDLVLHLIDDHGSQKTAFITGPENNPKAEDLFQAFQQALADRNIPLDEALIVQGSFGYEHGCAATEALLRRGVEFDAIVSIDDESTWGVMNTLHTKGYHVPIDVAVKGFDDIVGSQCTIPPLCTVRQPRHELGMQAFEMILAHLQGEKKPQTIMLATEMVVRQSCSCLSPSLKHVQMMEILPTESDEACNLAAQHEIIQNDLFQALDHLPTTAWPWVKEQSICQFEALYAEIVNGRSGSFLKEFDKILRQMTAASENLDILLDVLSVIQFQLLQRCGKGSKIAQQMETLWQQARILLSDVAQQAQVRQRLQSDFRTRVFFQINEEVKTAFDLPKLLDALTNALGQLEISFCYLCLNEVPDFNS